MHNYVMQNTPQTLIIKNGLPPDDTYSDEFKLDQSTSHRLNKLKVPHLKNILKLAQPVRLTKFSHETLNTPAELATAKAMDWPLLDGQLPFAALKAAQLGLTSPSNMPGGSWAFITLCSWHVQHGQVTFSGDAQGLGVSRAQAEQALQDMRPYFEEDSIHIISHPQLNPGQWLAYSTHFNGLPCASVERITGRVIDDYLIGTGKSADHISARPLRRLQNEMQMLLYQHAINEQSATPINSFWISDCGNFGASQCDLQSTLDDHYSIQVLDITNQEIQLLHPQDPNWLNAWAAEWEYIDETFLNTYSHAFLNAKKGTEITLCNTTTSIALTPLKSSWKRYIKSKLSVSKLTRLLGF